MTHDLGYRVVMKLMQNHLNKHHHIYPDNFFTTVTLAKDLLANGTYLCGTTRAHRREFPKKLANAELRPGESVKWTNGDGVMLMKWRDRRDVFMVATNDEGLDVVQTVRRNDAEVQLSTPTCIKRYNGRMGGVDRLDQLRVYYSVGRAGIRWWKYIFWGWLNIGIINAYILWKMSNHHLPPKSRFMGLKSWKIRLIHDLVDSVESSRVWRRASAVDNLEVEHIVAGNIVDGHPLARFSGRKRSCKQCVGESKKTAKGRHIETRFECSRCKVYLCRSGHCFQAYHQWKTVPGRDEEELSEEDDNNV